MGDVVHYFLMAIGTLFSIAGLVLIFRRTRTDTGAAKVEFLGQKLEANSTGIVVFLIGAAFLAAPLFAPVQSQQITAPSASPPTQTASTPNSSAKTVPATENAVSAEVEDNSSFATANVITNGARTGGYLGRGDQDLYVLDVGNGIEKRLTLKFKFLGDACANFYVYDAIESTIGFGLNCNGDGITTQSFDIPQGKIYLSVIYINSIGNYTLTAASN